METHPPGSLFLFIAVQMVLRLPLEKSYGSQKEISTRLSWAKGLGRGVPMSFRVERRVTARNSVVLFVSGTIQGGHVDTLREAVIRETGGVALDLEHVSLVDQNAVKLLGQYEADGIEIKNCPAYVREWISRERADGRKQ
jgi:hypothetical protein